MLRYIFVIITIFLLSTTGVFNKDLFLGQGNFTLSVSGTGGKISLNFKDEDSLVFDFASFTEKTQSGTDIDVSDPRTHSFKAFSGLNFDVSDFVEEKYQSLDCFSTEIKTNNFLSTASLSTKIYYFKQDGKIEVGKDLFENVQKGSISMSFVLSNWKFCNNNGTATDEKICNINGTAITNSVLDFAFNIKSKVNGILNILPARGGNYSYGNSTFAYFSPNYVLDDVTPTEMPPTFPSLVVNSDNTNTYTLRFNKAAKSLKWSSLFVIRKTDIVPQPPTPTPTPVSLNSTLGNYTLELVGRSGKINMKYLNETRLTFEFSKLTEVLRNGTAVEKKAVNHTFENFANLDFEISNFTNTTYQNLVCLQSTIKLKNFFRNTTLDASLYIFNQSGLIKTGAIKVNDTSSIDVFENVTQGSVKLSLGVSNWIFCTNETIGLNYDPNCVVGVDTQNLPSELELEVIIKSKSDKIECSKKNNNAKLNSCKMGESSASFSPYYVIDGVNNQMPDGYPKLVNTGNTNTFSFRFANFKTNLAWDPIFQVNDVQPTPEPSPQPPKPTPKDETDTFNTTEIKINHLGGALQFIYSAEINKTTNDFNIRFSSIKEVDGDGKSLSTSGHSVDSLTNVDFLIGNKINAKFGELNVTVIKMESINMTNASKLTANVYHFEQSGILDISGKKYNVKKGDVKFDLAVEKWNFCQAIKSEANSLLSGNCKINDTYYENAAYLELEFKVVEAKKAKGVKNSDTSVSYGGSEFVVPATYTSDGKSANMVANYPKFNPTESSDSYVLRFTPFKTNVVYDPVVIFPESTKGSSILIVILIILALIIIALAVFLYCRSKGDRKYSDAIEKRSNFMEA